MTTYLNRRKLLRGMLGGTAVAVALPLLDCFLDSNGTALASGSPLPVRFGTWFWGLGSNHDRWVPSTVGADYVLSAELASIEKFKDQVSIFSGFNCPLDGRGNLAHISGWQAIRSGTVPGPGITVGPSLDVIVADSIGQDTRFRSLEISAVGDPANSFSQRTPSQINPAEVEPLAFYNRVFGSEFQDPNAADFKPNPQALVRQSVLSAITDSRQDLLRRVGSADRQRLDEYFTSVRSVEQQIALQLQKPAPNEACSVPPAPEHVDTGHELSVVARNHDLLAQILVLALACNQTKVFNVAISESGSNIFKSGEDRSHHQLTHEEPVDLKLGYQPLATSFVLQYMKNWSNLLSMMSAVKEGDGTLLDHSVVFAHSDSNFAKTHAVDGIPMMIAGKGAGRIRSGIHVPGKGDPVTRVGLSILQAYGVNAEKFGTASLESSRPLTEIFA
jgi:hypothetical protein